MKLPYQDRIAAGRELANCLDSYRERPDLLVLALPRGGVPVAAEVARSLQAPLDVLVVRKLGLPGQKELAMGAIAGGGICLRNDEVVGFSGVSSEAFGRVELEERAELKRREKAYRGDRPFPELEGKCVILVDDGLATGSTMRAAVQAVRQAAAAEVVVAVPVAPPDTIANLRDEADTVVCPATPEHFSAIGQFYADFSQTSDEEVRECLRSHWE